MFRSFPKGNIIPILCTYLLAYLLRYLFYHEYFFCSGSKQNLFSKAVIALFSYQCLFILILAPKYFKIINITSILSILLQDCQYYFKNVNITSMLLMLLHDCQYDIRIINIIYFKIINITCTGLSIILSNINGLLYQL